MQNPINLTIERFQENGQDYYVATSPDILYKDLSLKLIQ